MPRTLQEIQPVAVTTAVVVVLLFRLLVTAVKDSRTYPTGIQASDEEVASLPIVSTAFHREWNDTVRPQDPPSGSHVI